MLIPVAHVGDTDRPDHALEFGRSVAPALLERNPDIVLHHMHDQLQDVLMAERMSYFRVKWRRTICAGAVPFWIHFAVQPALQALNEYLYRAEPYSDVNVFLFEHGTRSPGIATAEEFQAVIGEHGARVHLDGLDPARFPHDIGTLGRYGRVFDRLPRARHPWSPLSFDEALRGLAAGGLSITTGV